MNPEIISLIIMVFLTSYGHVMLKHCSAYISFNKNPIKIIQQMLRIDLITGAAAVLTAPLFYFFALKKLELNTAYSFTALSQILIPALSFIFLKEKINLKKLSAVLLIASGIFIWNQ